ncbi:MAG TPA: ABC transporter permease [Mycobacteriales bacterium]|nr:ABC transporter permease [Mycobacteriales bacterium]
MNAAATVRLQRLAVPGRIRILGVVGILLGVLMLSVFGAKPRHNDRLHFGLAPGWAWLDVPTISMSASVAAYVLGVVVIVLGVLQAARPLPQRVTTAFTAVMLIAFIVGFLAWATAGSTLDITALGSDTMQRSVPLILGALCGVLCERSGVINIAIEGQFLVGAFTAAIVASAFASIWLGLIGAALAGAILGMVLAVLAIRYLVDQVILGVVLNVFALGLTNFLYRQILIPRQDSLNSPDTVSRIRIPGLSQIPIIGPILFDGNIFLYITYVLLIVLQLAIFHTRWGLRLRSVGEHPTAADTVGIKVLAIRYRAVILGGLIAGIAGASFTIGSVGGFGENITSGKGYIALAAVIFGAWTPRGALAAALLFGFADTLESRLGADPPIPSEFLSMAPYVVTILAVAGLVGRVRSPKADGQPYVKS